MDIRNLTEQQAREIYFASYWTPLRCEELPPKVGEVVMNIGVNCGKSRAARWLQQSFGVEADGIIGPVTLSMAKHYPPDVKASQLLYRTEFHYREIGRGKLAKYLRGWLNRNNDLRAFLNVPGNDKTL